MIHEIVFDYWEFAHKEPLIALFMCVAMLSSVVMVVNKVMSTIASFGPAGREPQIEDDDDEEDDSLNIEGRG
jgi:hypothetical protein